MSNTLALTKVILKSSLSGFSATKNKALNILIYAVAILFGLVPMIAILFYMFSDIMATMVSINQEIVLINFVLAILTIMILIFSMLHVPSVYYFSNDTEFFLTLPVKPYEILLSKLIVVTLFEYAFVALIYVPFMIIYVTTSNAMMSIPFAIIVGLILPLFPVLISSLIIILLMNFVPFFRNKNVLNMIIGLISISLALGINIGIQGSLMDQQVLIDLIQQGNNSLGVIYSVLPNVLFGGQAITNQSVVSLVIYILINLVALALYLFFAQQFYLNGATSINDSAKNKKRFNQEQLTNAKSGSIVKEFFMRDVKSLFRIPPYFLNIVLPTLIMPVLIIVLPMLSSNSQDFSLSDLTPFINDFLSSSESILYIGVLGGVLLGLFTSMTNTLSVTIISRDAKVLDHIKTYPIDYFKMILGKLMVSWSISFLTILLLLFTINYVITLPLILNIIVLVVGLLVTLFSSLLFGLIDLYRPNLKWTNEVQVVKQGINVFVSTFGSMIIIGIFIGIGLFLMDYKIAFSVGAIVMLVLGISIFVYYLKNHVDDMILKIEV